MVPFLSHRIPHKAKPWGQEFMSVIAKRSGYESWVQWAMWKFGGKWNILCLHFGGHLMTARNCVHSRDLLSPLPSTVTRYTLPPWLCLIFIALLWIHKKSKWMLSVILITQHSHLPRFSLNFCCSDAMAKCVEVAEHWTGSAASHTGGSPAHAHRQNQVFCGSLPWLCLPLYASFHFIPTSLH